MPFGRNQASPVWPLGKSNFDPEFYSNIKLVPSSKPAPFCFDVQDGSNMTGTDLCVNKPHCAAAVRP